MARSRWSGKDSVTLGSLSHGATSQATRCAFCCLQIVPCQKFIAHGHRVYLHLVNGKSEAVKPPGRFRNGGGGWRACRAARLTSLARLSRRRSSRPTHITRHSDPWKLRVAIGACNLRKLTFRVPSNQRAAVAIRNPADGQVEPPEVSPRRLEFTNCGLPKGNAHVSLRLCMSCLCISPTSNKKKRDVILPASHC